MNHYSKIMPKVYKSYSRKDIEKTSKVMGISRGFSEAMGRVSAVLPFRVSNYVVDELIDWDDISNDPIFHLTFPQSGMLAWHDHERLKKAFNEDPSGKTAQPIIREIRMRMNPHPAGQMEINVPSLNGKALKGMQHKYDETALLFPLQGQTCHSYCNYCFRWVQFSGMDDIRFSTSNVDGLIRYLDSHGEVTDLLITGGDPLVMRSKVLRRYIEPLIKKRPGNLTSIRVGTKSLAYWPYRFVTDKDADDLMRLFEEIRKAGFHFSFMAHISHGRELETRVVQAAIRRILATGTTIRCQAPLVKHVNDDPDVWAKMWKVQVKLGLIPYYMFVVRDTGSRSYFKVPLARAYDIFTRAYSRVSGLCRTVRGPSLSATPGKILIDGITEIAGERVFALKFLQGRNPDWVNRIFFARYDRHASWLDELEPAFGHRKFFYEERLEGFTRPEVWHQNML